MSKNDKITKVYKTLKIEEKVASKLSNLVQSLNLKFPDAYFTNSNVLELILDSYNKI